MNDDLTQTLNKALAANDLHAICDQLGASIFEVTGVTIFSKASKVDRTTLYRAFRIKRDLSLETLIKVLTALGLRLTFVAKTEVPESVASARRFSKALASGDPSQLAGAFARSLRSQPNVTRFAEKAGRSREALYRTFAGPGTPRFSTVLCLVAALELQLVVAPMRHRTLRGV